MRHVAENEVGSRQPATDIVAEGPWIPAAADSPPTVEQYNHLLEAYGRLEEEYRRRAVALATAAHELKTPLSIMTGYMELLLSDKLGDLGERQRRVLSDMRENGVRLQQFIQDFLTYSALETGNVRLRCEVADLNAVLQEVCSFWLQRFQDNHVALYVLPSERLKPFPFDSFKIQHIISNLLDNALKFSPPGGTVWLSAEPYHWERRSGKPAKVANDRRKRAEWSTNAARITVSDTGPGLAPEFHSEVFDDFSKGPAPNGHQPDGMGLGLAIARRLVLAHGGKIWVESEPGQGSKFCLLIPTKREAEVQE
ncbi:MAG TPA: HAMP domain-containing sensor histidine kinase [Terriglobales bacterium]|nr:HAMP domain-containing sensor histidine kinase [Terriglobales bacterium]